MWENIVLVSYFTVIGMLSILAILVAVWGDELEEDRREMVMWRDSYAVESCSREQRAGTSHPSWIVVEGPSVSS